MRLKCSLEPVDMGSEIVAVPIGSEAGKAKGVLKLNRTGFEVLELLETETTEDEIINKLASKYDDDKQTIRDYIREVIDVLKNADLLLD